MEPETFDEADRLAVRARPSGWPIKYQHWGQLLFLHWSLPAESLRPLIPDPLVIETFDGARWIGITPFTMWGVRPAFLPPIPVLSEAHEVNVRTYVHLNGVPGIWFFSLDVSNSVAALGARLTFHLPYFHARMSLERRNRTLRFASRRTCPHAAPPGSKLLGPSVIGCRPPSRVPCGFSSPNGMSCIPLAGTPSTAPASSTTLGLCTKPTCYRVDRRCSNRRGCLLLEMHRCFTSRANL